MTTPPDGPPPPSDPYGAPPPTGPYGAPPPTGPYGAAPSLRPHGASEQVPYGPPGGAGPGPQPPAEPPTDVVSVLGLVLGFLLAPVGLVLSIVGLVRTAGGKRKGRGFAVAGLVVSVLVTVAATVAAVALVSYVVEETGTAIEEIEEGFATSEPFPTSVPLPVEPFPTGEEAPDLFPDGAGVTLPLGEGADIDGLRLTVTAVDLDADAAVAAESAANPAPDGRYVLVSGTVENTSGQAQSVYFGLNVGYVSAVGSVYDESTCSAEVTGAPAGMPDLEPGASTEVRWCLVVPVEEVGDGTVLVVAGGSDATAVWADR